jgi:hypothetical protein
MSLNINKACGMGVAKAKEIKIGKLTKVKSFFLVEVKNWHEWTTILYQKALKIDTS